MRFADRAGTLCSSGRFERLEVAYESAPHHVALEGDVVAGGEHRRAALAERHFAAAEDADANYRPFGDMTQRLVAEIMGQIVERHDRAAAKSIAPMRFSVSSGLREAEDWAALPGDDREMTSTRKLLPVLDSLAVTRMIGAVGIDPRRSAVRSPARATARSIAGLFCLNGNSANSSSFR